MDEQRPTNILRIVFFFGYLFGLIMGYFGGSDSSYHSLFLGGNLLAIGFAIVLTKIHGKILSEEKQKTGKDS